MFADSGVEYLLALRLRSRRYTSCLGKEKRRLVASVTGIPDCLRGVSLSRFLPYDRTGITRCCV